MKHKIAFLLLAVVIIVIISGCTQQDQVDKKADLTDRDTGDQETPLADTETTEDKQEEAKPEIVGPGGCKSDKECGTYCSTKPIDCAAWCDQNEQTCSDLGVQIDIPKGIPGWPCTSDSECQTGLCLNFKCDIPTPDNLAKKSGFSLPGGCTSIQDCAQLCSKPENLEACQTFCSNFPSFCSDLNSIRTSQAPEECKSCTNCEEKSCIQDCTYRCFQYTPIDTTTKEDIDSLKQGLVLERNYQEPIKAVWEPGPAYNRMGVTYFIDDYKGLGVNTYSITPKYNRKDGKLVHSVDHTTGEGADNEKIASIIKAKKAGFQVVLVAHDLYDMFPDANKNEDFSPEDYIDEIKATSLKWAKIAEDYKVEYFVPVNEFEYILYENGYTAEKACEITNKMYQEVIPKVREKFKGKIYCRVGGMDAKFGCMDFSQCDVFGFTYGFSGGDPKTNFESAFNVGEQLSTKYGKKYLMAEAFMLLIRGSAVSDCANLHKAGIQAYKEKANNGIGYTFMGLIQKDPINKNDCTIEQAGVVEDYKNFFSWIDQNN